MKKNKKSDRKLTDDGKTEETEDLRPASSPPPVSDIPGEEISVREEEQRLPPTELPLSRHTAETDALEKEKKKRWIHPLTVFIILAVAAVAILVAALFIMQNIDKRLSAPLTIKGEKIGNAEFSFMYHEILRSNGVDIYRKGSDAILDSPGENNFETQRDYFLDLTARTLQKRNILYDDAIANDFKPGEDDRQMAESYVDWLHQKARDLNISTETFTKGYFGEYVTVDIVREIMTRQYFTENYEVGVKLEQLKATQDQAEAAYQNAPQLYDEITYRVLRIVFENTGASFVETANIHAEEILEKTANDESRFETVAAEYFTGKAKEKLLQKDSTLLQNVRYDKIKNAQWRAWLFDPSRKSGDGIIFKDEQEFPIIFCFSKRERQTEAYRDVHLIYLNREENAEGAPGFPDNDILPLAQSIYDEIVDENSITRLTNTHSDDTLEGKIKFTHDESFYRGSYPEEVDDWVFDEGRKSGDKIILELADQAVVLFYDGASPNPEWFDKVNSYIRRDNYENFLNEKRSVYPYVFDDKALQFVTGVSENSILSGPKDTKSPDATASGDLSSPTTCVPA